MVLVKGGDDDVFLRLLKFHTTAFIGSRRKPKAGALLKQMVLL